jgi:hypothetical protein
VRPPITLLVKIVQCSHSRKYLPVAPCSFYFLVHRFLFYEVEGNTVYGGEQELIAEGRLGRVFRGKFKTYERLNIAYETAVTSAPFSSGNLLTRAKFHHQKSASDSTAEAANIPNHIDKQQ